MEDNKVRIPWLVVALLGALTLFAASLFYTPWRQVAGEAFGTLMGGGQVSGEAVTKHQLQVLGYRKVGQVIGQSWCRAKVLSGTQYYSPRISPHEARIYFNAFGFQENFWLPRNEISEATVSLLTSAEIKTQVQVTVFACVFQDYWNAEVRQISVGDEVVWNWQDQHLAPNKLFQGWNGRDLREIQRPGYEVSKPRWVEVNPIDFTPNMRWEVTAFGYTFEVQKVDGLVIYSFPEEQTYSRWNWQLVQERQDIELAMEFDQPIMLIDGCKDDLPGDQVLMSMSSNGYLHFFETNEEAAQAVYPIHLSGSCQDYQGTFLSWPAQRYIFGQVWLNGTMTYLQAAELVR